MKNQLDNVENSLETACTMESCVDGLKVSSIDKLGISTSLDYKIFNNWEQIYKLETQWNELMGHTAYPSIYSSIDFCFTGWTHFHKDESTPYVIAFFDPHSDQLVGVFPLRKEKSYVHHLTYQLLMPLTTTESDKPYPLIREGYEKIAWSEFSRALNEHSKDWDVLNWQEIPVGFHGIEEVRQGLVQKRYRVETEEDAKGPLMDLDLDWDTFKGQHRKLRKALTRINNRLEGGVHLQVFESVEDILVGLQHYADIEGKSWKLGSVGVSRNPETYKFYVDLCNALAAKGQIKIGILFHGTIAISGEVSYICEDRVFFSHGTYDNEYRDHSPGKISTGLFIKEHLGGQYKVGDFLAGFSHYLSPWSNVTLETQRLVVYNRQNYRVWLIWSWREFKTQAKNVLKKNAKVHELSRNLYTKLTAKLGVDVD